MMGIANCHVTDVHNAFTYFQNKANEQLQSCLMMPLCVQISCYF